MSSAKKLRELQRATTEHDKRKLSADIACSNHAMFDMAEAIIAKDNEQLRATITEQATQHERDVATLECWNKAITEQAARIKELEDALREARNWFESQAKITSKGCPSSWELMELREERDKINELIGV